jgi:Chalcone isomerase-like
MKKTVVAAVLALAVTAAIAMAGEVAGVQMEPTQTVEGKTLKLNGMGLRTKMVFKVYVLGLYLENPSKDAAAVIAADEVKCIHMAFVRSVSGSKVSETISEGFERNAKAQMPALKGRLEKLAALIPDVVSGDLVTLTYVPGKGTVVSVKGAEKGVIEGKDFSDALLSVWLGANPVQADLKQALLGG